MWRPTELLRFFHRRIVQREPLLHEVDAQHDLRRERRAAALAFWQVWRHQDRQVSPRQDLLRLAQELPAPRSLGLRSRAKAFLLHG